MSARGGEIILLDRGVAFTDMQLCRSSFELVYTSRLSAFLPAVCSGSATLYLRLSVTALPESVDDFDMLKNPMRCSREVVFEVLLRSRSRPNMIVGWHNVEIFNIPPSCVGELYVKVPSWWDEFEPSRALAIPTPTSFAYNFLLHARSDPCRLRRLELRKVRVVRTLFMRFLGVCPFRCRGWICP